jgi:hypothetical protein
MSTAFERVQGALACWKKNAAMLTTVILFCTITLLARILNVYYNLRYNIAK